VPARNATSSVSQPFQLICSFPLFRRPHPQALHTTAKEAMVESRMESIGTLTNLQSCMESMTGELQDLRRQLAAFQQAAARDSIWASHRQASLEGRVESIENLADRQASLENRMESLGDTQATLDDRVELLRQTVEAVADRALDREDKLEKRMGQIEKVSDQLAGEHVELQYANFQAAKDRRFANDRFASFEDRFASLEKFVEALDSRMITSIRDQNKELRRLKDRMDLIETFTQEQMSSLQQTTRHVASVSERQGLMRDEVHDLQIATEQAATDLVSVNDQLQNLLAAAEQNLTKEQTATEQAKEQTATEKAAIENLTEEHTATEQAAIENLTKTADELQALLMQTDGEFTWNLVMPFLPE